MPEEVIEVPAAELSVSAKPKSVLSLVAPVASVVEAVLAVVISPAVGAPGAAGVKVVVPIPN